MMASLLHLCLMKLVKKTLKNKYVMPNRPCLVQIGDFVRVRKYDDVYGYVSGIDIDDFNDNYYIEIDRGIDKDPLYLYDNQLEVVPIIKE